MPDSMSRFRPTRASDNILMPRNIGDPAPRHDKCADGHAVMCCTLRVGLLLITKPILCSDKADGSDLTAGYCVAALR
jgi:hypothetical protein